MSKLSKQEKLDIIVNESPELLQLLEDFKSNVKLVREKVQPLLTRVKEGQLPTSRGSTYLEMKYRMFLISSLSLSRSLCTNFLLFLSFYRPVAELLHGHCVLFATKSSRQIREGPPGYR
jgi:hypothetical protein